MSTIDVGMDLGTTNSCVAINQDGETRALSSASNQSVTPSAVWIRANGRMQVGLRAYNQIGPDPANVATEFKRAMGEMREYAFPASGRTMSPEALSAEVLKALREDVQRHTGATPSAAVITVPAAFGTLQCEATGQAAALAGLEEYHLLQEPIAAAIAYGVRPGAEDQRWMVFDLGGGTLDIAIVSTRDGRLSVIEHGGDNQLGGKDIDLAITRDIFIPRLAAEHELATARSDPEAHDQLLRQLRFDAEREKIGLSQAEEVQVYIDSRATDIHGNRIDGEFTLSREDLERAMRPVLDRCTHLALQTLKRAGLESSQLDRVLLVGGPTQTPAIRARLEEALGVDLDFSLDPMTVVATGAAIYASTLERRTAAARPSVRGSTSAPTTAGAEDPVDVKLAHERTWSQDTCPVAGSTDDPRVEAFKIDRQDGVWSSGWCGLEDGFFEVDVLLDPGKSNKFWIYARDASGTLLPVQPDGFTIQHGLHVDAPPLPHTIGTEVQTDDHDGRTEVEALFARNTRLPTRVERTFRTTHELRPGSSEDVIAIKFWEGEHAHDASANEFLGAVSLRGSDVRRILPAGSEIELSVELDTSRRITVEAFVPRLNESFDFDFYAEREDQGKVLEAATDLDGEITQNYDRLEAAEGIAMDEDAQAELGQIRRELTEIDAQQAELAERPDTIDADEAKRIVARSRDIKGRIGALESSLGIERGTDERNAGLKEALASTRQTVEQYGTPTDEREFHALETQATRAMERNASRAIERATTALGSLRFRIHRRQPGFWIQLLEHAEDCRGDLLDPSRADRLLEEGNAARSRGDVDGMQAAVAALWKLLPQSAEETAAARALRTGLRRH